MAGSGEKMGPVARTQLLVVYSGMLLLLGVGVDALKTDSRDITFIT